MQPRSERDIFAGQNERKRFDADEAHRILERAAAEQSRRERRLDGSYSLGELEEIAAEAGISREALRVALERGPGRFAWLHGWLPATWSPALRGVVLTTMAAAALLALLLAFPELAYAILFGALLILAGLLLVA